MTEKIHYTQQADGLYTIDVDKFVVGRDMTREQVDAYIARIRNIEELDAEEDGENEL